MTSTATDETPKVWIGCLHCDNSGHLVDWPDAVGADEVTLADVHKGSARGWAACEERWVLNHLYIPVSGEQLGVPVVHTHSHGRHAFSFTA